MNTILRLAILLVIAAGTAGCVTTAERTAASIDGACDAFPPPKQVVRGADRYSRLWVNETLEAGIAACGWKRPRRAAKASA